MIRSNKGLRLCGYGIPGQIFYALDVPEPKSENEVVTDSSEADGSSASTDVLKEIQNLASVLNPHNMAQQ